MLRNLRNLWAGSSVLSVFRSNQPPRNRPSFSPQLDALQSKVLPTAALVGGDLVVTGSFRPDTVTVATEGAFYRVTENGAHRYFRMEAVTGTLRFSGGRGSDTFTNLTGLRTYASGDDGNDILLGGSGIDEIYGGFGDDYILGGFGEDYLYGGFGRDTLFAGADQSDNYLDGGDGDDVLHGGNGNDWLVGRWGNDFLYGHAGDDHLEGMDGKDHLYGGAGNDRLDGGYDGGYDELFGGAGLDLFHRERRVVYNTEWPFRHVVDLDEAHDMNTEEGDVWYF